ncbi:MULTISPECIES: GNAT family N-acetyltransferase [unclassified Streptococcus]|uniref:GNAT family N-acetyltransferase n=1 Tax=unclassified Streptococcus TaxID=2608887 RepID=UPI0010720C7B|nr:MULTISPECIES: GNAT family N-acetyltransferase [unclassified Streptococcus]MBF0786826.1 GNAT family N-acetyltransferase [Streptococcus sp. 19428wC2_LYSM12]MCQ9211066.1 GNAT family N-acetyltransferase [Streptococcus sp. B01]MCQ9214341.1 GNAT family N-acetyltransferase [Streptococcus sp. O1]TFV06369.1 GNAT family N-acetyltransferase [Streptococcus sp. LYSM12]
MITLKLVDETTFESVIQLSVAPKDERRLASNLYSLAQAWLYREKNQLEPLAILASNQVVGFLLLLKEGEKESYLIWRLMIGQAYQNRGYGTEALKWVIRRARNDPACSRLITSYVVGNHKMRGILDGLGFQSTGLATNEIVMMLEI